MLCNNNDAFGWNQNKRNTDYTDKEKHLDNFNLICEIGVICGFIYILETA
jgi:hypothetical protein